MKSFITFPTGYKLPNHEECELQMKTHINALKTEEKYCIILHSVESERRRYNEE